jgi:hypothetical protein
MESLSGLATAMGLEMALATAMESATVKVSA